jgi:hypothetical protein
MTIKDNGDWLSAEQAVRPDGTEIECISLINKKLPPLTGEQAVVHKIEETKAEQAKFQNQSQ